MILLKNFAVMGMSTCHLDMKKSVATIEEERRFSSKLFGDLISSATQNGAEVHTRKTVLLKLCPPCIWDLYSMWRTWFCCIVAKTFLGFFLTLQSTKKFAEAWWERTIIRSAARRRNVFRSGQPVPLLFFAYPAHALYLKSWSGTLRSCEKWGWWRTVDEYVPNAGFCGQYCASLAVQRNSKRAG